MMRSALVVAPILAAASIAHAQPEGACHVAFARAPDGVRAEIEKWVAAEPHCARAVELRVVETADGKLYVFARDDRGYTRDRVVPDAATAGALVASWIADDAVDGVWVADDPEPAAAMPLPVPAAAAPARVTVDRGRGFRVAGVTSAVAGLALATYGAYQDAVARHYAGVIANQDPNVPWDANIAELEARGRRADRIEKLAFVGAGALVATGLAMYVTGRMRSAEHVVVVPTASPTGGGVSLGGHF